MNTRLQCVREQGAYNTSIKHLKNMIVLEKCGQVVTLLVYFIKSQFQALCPGLHPATSCTVEPHLSTKATLLCPSGQFIHSLLF